MSKMENKEFLNFIGLSNFLNKLKTLFAFKTEIPTKTSQLINDSGFKTTDYTHPSYTAKSSGLYKITVDETGHISSVTPVTKEDIIALGIISVNSSFEVKEDGNLYINY